MDSKFMTYIVGFIVSMYGEKKKKKVLPPIGFEPAEFCTSKSVSS